jgi:hypothetical protein
LEVAYKQSISLLRDYFRGEIEDKAKVQHFGYTTITVASQHISLASLFLCLHYLISVLGRDNDAISTLINGQKDEGVYSHGLSTGV